MGGAAVINILANIIRMKFVAVFIGTIGVGLMSSFTSIQNILCVLTGFGIHSSSVREIAAANASQDQKKIGTTIIVLRRVSIFAGFCGMVLTASFASLISQIVLDEPKYTFEIIFLGLILIVFSFYICAAILITKSVPIKKLNQIIVFIPFLTYLSNYINNKFKFFYQNNPS